VRTKLQSQSITYLERWRPDNVPRCSVYLKYTEVPREKGGEEGEREDSGRGGEGIGDNIVQVRNHVPCVLKLHVLTHDVDTISL